MRRKTEQELRSSGTWRADRHGKHEAAGTMLKELPPPPFPLTNEALAIYSDEGLNLIEQKMLRVSDLRTLAAYAREFAVYLSEMEKAGDNITTKFKNGMTGQNPHRKAAENALKLALNIGAALGLNPAARARIKGNAAFKDEGPTKPDPIKDFLPKKQNHTEFFN